MFYQYCTNLIEVLGVKKDLNQYVFFTLLYLVLKPDCHKKRKFASTLEEIGNTVDLVRVVLFLICV